MTQRRNPQAPLWTIETNSAVLPRDTDQRRTHTKINGKKINEEKKCTLFNPVSYDLVKVMNHGRRDTTLKQERSLTYIRVVQELHDPYFTKELWNKEHRGVGNSSHCNKKKRM